MTVGVERQPDLPREAQGPDDAKRPDVSVVIVAYHNDDALTACLASVPRGIGSLRSETIVVDNGSSAEAAEQIRSSFPGVVYDDPGENLGFARGCNRGAAAARAEFILFLNPDTIVHEGSIHALVDFARAHPETGLVGGRTLHPDGSLDPRSCWGEMTLWSLFCFATGLSAIFSGHELFDPESMGRWPRDTVREVGLITGCLLLVSRGAWTRLGGFDPDFFVYGEDADLSMRARQLGYRPSITPDAVITHVVGASSSTPVERIVLRNTGATTLIRKRWTGWRRTLALALFKTGVALRTSAYVTAGSLSRRWEEQGAAWRQIWRRRGEWWPGYTVQGRRTAARLSGATTRV